MPMNLDALFEDIESQGYFASKTEPPGQALTPARQARVSFLEPKLTSIGLQGILKGNDFIAGFDACATSLTWLVIPDSGFALIELFEPGTGLDWVDLSLEELANKKLLKQQMRVKFRMAQPDIVGSLVGFQCNILELLALDRRIYVPVFAVEVMVVENLSKFS